MSKPKTKYLNGYRRELVLWVCSLQLILESHRAHFKGSELKWLDSIVMSIETLCKLMLSGIDETELRTIDHAIKRVKPKLFADDLISQEKPIVKVSQELIYDLAESAVALCAFDCLGDYDSCPRRKMFLDLLIPPYRTDGPCQFYQKDE